MIATIDSSGIITHFAPTSLKSSREVSRSGKQLVQQSFRLDNKRGSERFFALYSNEILYWQDVERSIQQAFQTHQNIHRITELDISSGVYQITGILEKP